MQEEQHPASPPAPSGDCWESSTEVPGLSVVITMQFAERNIVCNRTPIMAVATIRNTAPVDRCRNPTRYHRWDVVRPILRFADVRRSLPARSSGSPAGMEARLRRPRFHGRHLPIHWNAVRIASRSRGHAAEHEPQPESIGSRTQRLVSATVIRQVAVSLLITIGGGLFVRTLQNLRSLDLGFSPQQVVQARISPV